jgi:hypothetical protein
MIGDLILVYDPEHGFFAGNIVREKNRTKYYVPKWTWLVNEARMSCQLAVAARTVRRFGGKARVISETQARRIEAYRNVQLQREL